MQMKAIEFPKVGKLSTNMHSQAPSYVRLKLTNNITWGNKFIHKVNKN